MKSDPPTNAPATDTHVVDCENCDGLTILYNGLVLMCETGEIILDGEMCLNGCDPLLVSVTVHS